MPIYEYVCQDCDEKYEKFVRSLSAKIELTCPKCGSHKGEKALSMFGSVGGSSTSGSFGSLGPSGAAVPSCGPIG